MALTEKDLAAIRAEAKAGAAEALAENNAAIAADLSTAVCEAGDNSGLVRDIIAALRAEGVVPEIDHEIVGNDGPYYWTRGSVKNLPPGRRFLSKRSVQFCRTPEELALVTLNCGIDEHGNVVAGARFGDGFAQADSGLTPRLQGESTSHVHPVVQLGFGFVLDRTRTVTESTDGFPITFAFRDLSPQEELEWCRLTGLHIASIGGGWKGSKP
jgi:hypothetical protein